MHDCYRTHIHRLRTVIPVFELYDCNKRMMKERGSLAVCVYIVSIAVFVFM